MSFVVILYFQLLAVALVYGILVCIKDARRRGRSPMLVCLLAVLLFPLGTVAWLLTRPERTKPTGQKGTTQFDLDDYRVQ